MTDRRLVVEDLVVEYATSEYTVRPIDGLSFVAEPGNLTVLLGPSGSGKTTLLSCVGGILTPTSGRIRLGDVDITDLDNDGLEVYRRDEVGFVFQAFNLLPSLSALENVAIPMMLAGRSKKDAIQAAEAALDQVGLSDRVSHKPSALSGGQQQRVAVARGIVHNPPLLIADEPTANLDYVQAEAIIGLLRELRSQGRTIVVSTHDARLVPVADTTVQMAADVETVDGPPQQVQYAAGELVFSQGDPGRLVYVIESGEIEIIQGRQRVALLDAGQYFGELAALMGTPRSATARANGTVTLTAYGPHEFKQQILDH